MKKSTVGRSLRLAAWGVTLGVVFGAGYATSALASGSKALETERGTLELAHLTSPFLECAGGINADLHLVRARDAAAAYIAQAREGDPSLAVSLYARDLNNGPWIGIDEKEPFLPASLSKVPVMLYTLAHAEGDPSILKREVGFPGAEAMNDQDSMSGAPESLRMQAGGTYTYDDLLYRMIVHSDNHARELLMTGFTEEDVNGLMATMHAGGGTEEGEFVMSPKEYSTYFRVLYNATFLGRPLSEYALELLSRGDFEGGIRRRLPGDVVVASKFGFRDDRTRGGQETTLHDCGIVYQPGTPYVLCVMTRSSQSSSDRLAEVISDLSWIVWNEKGGAPR